MTPLDRALRDRRVLVVCGPGGVGKTTVSAALALRAAGLGRHVLVCTIDPSRRLATSLGLKTLGDKPRPLPLAKLLPHAKGSCAAMTLDTKRTFDAIVERHAASPEARRRILDNRFYQQISAALSGSHEYMAMEKLLELSRDDRYDLVVLDTPPTRHALDFLEAPDRMLSFLDSSVLRYFLKPYFAAGRLTLKVASRTGALALEIADKALGLQFLGDLSEFFLAFDGMYDGFKVRAAAVFELLRDPSTGFVLVSTPASQSLQESVFFHDRLSVRDMPFVSFVVNRSHLERPRTARRRAAGGSARVTPGLARLLSEIYATDQRLARQERAAIARLATLAKGRLVRLPELESDVHDLKSLAAVAELLAGPANA